MSIDFDIDQRSVRRAEYLIQKKHKLELCLRAKVCPLCIDDLEISVGESMSTNYKCKKCSFVWPEKSD